MCGPDVWMDVCLQMCVRAAPEPYQTCTCSVPALYLNDLCLNDLCLNA